MNLPTDLIFTKRTALSFGLFLGAIALGGCGSSENSTTPANAEKIVITAKKPKNWKDMGAAERRAWREEQLKLQKSQ